MSWTIIYTFFSSFIYNITKIIRASYTYTIYIIFKYIFLIVHTCITTFFIITTWRISIFPSTFFTTNISLNIIIFMSWTIIYTFNWLCVWKLIFIIIRTTIYCNFFCNWLIKIFCCICTNISASFLINVIHIIWTVKCSYTYLKSIYNLICTSIITIIIIRT